MTRRIAILALAGLALAGIAILAAAPSDRLTLAAEYQDEPLGLQISRALAAETTQRLEASEAQRSTGTP